jgi:hypothetical protein
MFLGRVELSARMTWLWLAQEAYHRIAISPLPHLCACHRDESRAASAAREALFQPKDLVWLDPCDEHRDEVIKQAAAGIPNLKRPYPDSKLQLQSAAG